MDAGKPLSQNGDSPSVIKELREQVEKLKAELEIEKQENRDLNSLVNILKSKSIGPLIY